MTTAKYARAATKHLAPTPDITGISGLIRWYKADDLALADNSLVATWPDRSGNGADLTASGSLRPSLVQGRLNGKPAVVFSGAQRLASVAAGQPATDLTVFVVAANYKRSLVGSPMLVAWGSGGTNGWNLFADASVDANQMPPALIALKSGGTWAHNYITATAKPGRGDPVILAGQISGTTTKVRIDKSNEVADAGDSGSLDYGAGPVTLTLGDKGSAAGQFQGEIFEVLIFNRALTSDEIATVEDYLDQKWRVTADHASLFGVFNGESAVGSDYQIGLSWSPDGKRWRRYLSNPVFSKNGTGWERDLVKDPWVVFDGTQYVLFYSGWTSATSKFQIGRATSPDLTTWTRDSHNPIIALGGSGAIDEAGCSFPTVILDLEEADPTRRWKMWYCATNAVGKSIVGYAYSSDGITWTKVGMVLDVGATGAWDGIALQPGCVFKDDDGTWYLFYWGRLSATSNTHTQSGVATFTDPEGVYTKYAGNPTVTARYSSSPGASQALTADLASGGRTVTVADTSSFHVHEEIVLDRHTSSSTVPEVNRILTIDSGTQVTLEWPVVNAFPMSDSARIVAFAYNSVVPRSIRKLADGTFELTVIPFQTVADVAHTDDSVTLREASQIASLATLTSAAVFDYAAGTTMMLSDIGTWDELSSENLGPALIAVPGRFVVMPFVDETVVYPPTLVAATEELDAPFIDETRVYGIFSLFDPDRTFGGPGNGGETFAVRLAPNGTTETATLAANIGAGDTSLTLTGDSSLPPSEPFVVTIDDEVVYLVQLSAGSYRIRGRGVSNTTPASHTAGVTVTWGDSYDLALVAAADIAHDFTADINATGSTHYTGWLVCFDSSQAYLGGSRYPLHVAELLGVFDAEAGSGGTNRCDGAQPCAVSAPTGVSDYCPTGLCNPALITTDITAGDVALVRYVNPEASALDLGPRSVSIQSWFGLKRVDTTDHDVTLTNPNGIVVDTTGTYDTFTGSVNGVWAEPLPLATGIAPDASDDAAAPIATPNPVPWQTVTLPGTDRFFTDGIHYSEHGWPFGVLAVRQGNRRVPFWQSWDWHDFSYVYTGFGTDCTFAQVVVNRNGISTPGSALPGPQDIDGPDAVWDDATYFYGASWFVAIYSTPYLVIGPVIGGVLSGEATAPFLPSVIFPGGGGGPTITPPGPTAEGGSGGDISPELVGLFQAAAV